MQEPVFSDTRNTYGNHSSTTKLVRPGLVSPTRWHHDVQEDTLFLTTASGPRFGSHAVMPQRGENGIDDGVRVKPCVGILPLRLVMILEDVGKAHRA